MDNESSMARRFKKTSITKAAVIAVILFACAGALAAGGNALFGKTTSEADKLALMLFLGLGLVFFLIGAYFLHAALSGKFQKKLFEHIPPEKLDEFCAGAAKVGDKVWLNEKYLVMEGIETACIPLTGLVWAYQATQSYNFVPVSTYITLQWDDGRRQVQLPLRKQRVQSALRLLRHYHPTATYGYSHSLFKQFKANPMALRRPVEGETAV